MNAPVECTQLETAAFLDGIGQFGNIVMVLLAFVWLATVDWWQVHWMFRRHLRRMRYARIRADKTLSELAQ